MTEKKAPGFMLYDEAASALLHLSNEELGAIARAAIRYKLYDESEPELDSGLEFAFRLLQGTIDRDARKYAEKCRRNAENRRGKGNEG